MGQRIVPVTMGSPVFHTVDLHGLRITETDFPPSALLTPHVHDRTVVAVMVEGSFDLVIRGRTLACTPGTVLVEPGGERHANKVGQLGARTVVIEPTPLYEMQHLAFCRELLMSPGAFIHSPAATIAARLRRELHARDALAGFVLEELALRLLDAAAGHESTEPSRPMPTWLLRARELVHERLPRLLHVHDVAAEVGVHAVYLTKIFRERFGVSLGTYQRRRRLEWAAERLAAGESVADVAHRAGFADQAHFTRAFKRFSGRTPGRFRGEHAGPRLEQPRP
jgi:AraC family transcriptional regulator